MGYVAFAKTIIKSLFLKPSTRLYPMEKRAFYANTRGRIEIEIDKCIFCSLCQKKCPTQAIEVNKPNKTWSINYMRCIVCSACVDNCPKKCLIMANQYPPAESQKTIKVFNQK